MTLRQRIVLTLVLIAIVLITPAIVGLFSLRELRGIVEDLRGRDAVAAIALGRLQTALAEVQRSQVVYLALGPDPQRADAWANVEANLTELDAALRRLDEAGYGRVIDPARRERARLGTRLAEHRELVERGALAEAEQQDRAQVDPVYRSVGAALDSIGVGINLASAAQVDRAQRVATGAVTYTLLAVTAALLLALLIAGWLTATLTRPIGELRRGMALVAAGDFEPDLRIPPDRPDELGDLARSFDRMTEQLAELDRLKAEFVSVASHELKTPLSVIRGYVSLLIDGIYGEIAPEQRKVLGSVSDQADRLTRLVQQLLDVSRFEAGGGRLDLRRVELASFLGELATSFEALAFQSGIDFRVETDEALPEAIVADPDRLNEVVGNLLSNAFKFTPRDGSIGLRADAAEGGIEFVVRDSGIGIPPDKVPRIFEKFFQVENEAQPRSIGSGLGLAIAREIVEAHEGTITAESEVGRGTVFRVFLPQPSPAEPTT
jgi:signal transduction histidine kinase